MTSAASPPGFAAVIGDVVRSREHPNRDALQESLRGAFQAANGRVPAIQPLTSTLGDEFQGLYADLSGALDATLLVRLHLTGAAEVRFGVGWGEVTMHTAARAPFEQDGPAWWAARAALEQVTLGAAKQEMPREWRTIVVEWDGASERSRPPTASEPVRAAPGDLPAPRPSGVRTIDGLNAFLACRDVLLDRLDDRAARLAIAHLEGKTQAEMAAQEGITQSAVSQRLRTGGIYAITVASDLLAGRDR
ncbi:MAG TPA: SatD family protein [Actinomycetota bacterium]|nr:SatD family protein [Actinomycetota bacterium]